MGLAVFLCLAVACKPADPPAPAPAEESAKTAASMTPSPAWEAFVDQYIEDYLATHPGWAVFQGRHEYDGMLQDWSAEGIAAEIERLKVARDGALAFEDEALGDEGQYQRDYLVASIDRQLFWLDKAEWPFVNPAFYFDWMSDSLDPSPYITLDYAPLEERMEAFTRFAGNIPRAAGQIRANLRMPMSRTRLQYGIDSFGGMADYFRNDVPTVFAAVEDAELQARFAAANPGGSGGHA